MKKFILFSLLIAGMLSFMSCGTNDNEPEMPEPEQPGNEEIIPEVKRLSYIIALRTMSIASQAI